MRRAFSKPCIKTAVGTKFESRREDVVRAGLDQTAQRRNQKLYLLLSFLYQVHEMKSRRIFEPGLEFAF
jgi:hypothetical protein